jgi:hypothetical protein
VDITITTQVEQKKGRMNSFNIFSLSARHKTPMAPSASNASHSLRSHARFMSSQTANAVDPIFEISQNSSLMPASLSSISLSSPFSSPIKTSALCISSSVGSHAASTRDGFGDGRLHTLQLGAKWSGYRRPRYRQPFWGRGGRDGRCLHAKVVAM